MDEQLPAHWAVPFIVWLKQLQWYILHYIFSSAIKTQNGLKFQGKLELPPFEQDCVELWLSCHLVAFLIVDVALACSLMSVFERQGMQILV